ncbi:hypothetical protein N7457_008395 [Penicillium paradoxum]|uniref:uncharacterized protein n=1 Tax=Penicillium paradoxum TaxID=176176 RepID=UPI002548343C|nr:uncharacterized protein N7457_008395 [Penicillium paradoxum]KAJ5773499.1 hypothetical protein N7457_008395 [Penicillium paradoxum]
MRFSTVSVFTALAALASAVYTTPDYTKGPVGNAITSPGLNEIVPEGKAYTIKWIPSTPGPISLVLLRGPSTNVLPLQTIAEAIPNSGEYTWTPGTDLEADVTHYGILLVVEGTGQYQYSTQFGISAPAGPVHTSISTIETKPAAPTAAPTVGPTTIVEVISSTTFCPEDETTAPAVTFVPPPPTTATESTEVTTTICPETETEAPAVTSTRVTPTGNRAWTSIRLTTSAAPTGVTSAAPAASSPVYTGAAGRNVISFGAVMAGVLAAFAL